MTRLNEGLVTLATLATIAAGFFAWRSYDLATEVARFEAEAAALAPTMENNALVLTSVSERFILPSELTVEPIFDRPDVRGVAISIPLEGEIVNATERSIRLDNIVESVCGYSENRDLCNRYNISQLVIGFTINGAQNGTSVHVPQI